jgi:hypothetical protein
MMGWKTQREMTAPRGLRCALPSLVALVLAFWAGASMVGPARAEACSNTTQQVRDEQTHAAQLPDCRGYEQVSPVAKSGVDAVGSVGNVQTSPSGNGVSFFAVEPFPGTTGSAQLPSYLGVRSLSGGGWSTEGLEALAPPGAVEEVVGMTSDASKAIVEVRGEQSNLPCEPTLVVCAGVNESNVYVRDEATGSFQFLAVQPRTDESGAVELGFADATPGGSQILFETKAKLVPEAEPGVNLYEWDEAKPPTERVSLAGVLPSGAAPKQGSFAGPGGPAVNRSKPRSTEWPYYTQNTISKDGSRVFFSDTETGNIYMREPAAKKTLQLSAGNEPAFWRAATREGDDVFYTEGSELYRFNLNRFNESDKPEPEALAEARERLTTNAEGILGVLGISEEDGAYVYFAAHGVLAANANGNNENAIIGAENVYGWHNGLITFIVRLPGGEVNWRDIALTDSEAQGPSGGEKSSRVTSSGKQILFSSDTRLTSYNNNGFNEFYLYNSELPFSASNPVCVSCNPTETPATGQARLTNTNEALVAHPSPRNAFLTHNLASNGRRVFFETSEALVQGDANSQTKDVYEWEADGEGSCESDAQNHGCLYLISTGQSAQESYFGDASADGSDVFFFTRQGLTTQDKDNNADLYDARVDGGIPAQNPVSTPAPCAEEGSCRSASSNVPSVFGVSPSTTFSGVGNLAPTSPPLPTHIETRAEKLAKALKVCKGRSKLRRKSCERAARKRYGPVKQKARKVSRRRRHS